jgi:hypothetical protein
VRVAPLGVPMVGSWLRRHAFCLVALVIRTASANAAWASQPLEYGTLPDADGIQRSVTFKGEIDGGSITGDLVVEGNTMHGAGVVTRSAFRPTLV